VYSLIFRRPDSPSLCSFSSEGTTVISSCRIIDAEMYGMMPRPKIVLCWSEPPVKTAKYSASRPTPPPTDLKCSAICV